MYDLPDSLPPEVLREALNQAALNVMPGPDGQDYLDRAFLIRRWVADAAEELGVEIPDLSTMGPSPKPSLSQWLDHDDDDEDDDWIDRAGNWVADHWQIALAIAVAVVILGFVGGDEIGCSVHITSVPNTTTTAAPR